MALTADNGQLAFLHQLMVEDVSLQASMVATRRADSAFAGWNRRTSDIHEIALVSLVSGHGEAI